MAQQQTFTTSNGRRWISVPDPGGGKNIGLYYEATEAEVNRVKNKTYTVNGTPVPGELYTATVGGKNYVLHSSYVFESNRYVYRPNPPAEETENGNAQQFLEIERNTSLKQQITSGVTTGPGGTTPTTPGTPGPGGTTPPTVPTPDEQGGSTPVIQPSTGNQPADTMLVYPEDLGSSDQDRIKFQALIYSSSPSRIPSDGFEIKPVSFNPTGPAIFLPIQSPIIDQNTVGWEPDTLNPVELYAVGLSRRIMESGGAEDVTARVGVFFKEAIESLRANSSEVRTYLAGQAVGVNNLLSRVNGKVLNPNLELLFQGPQLRPFNFTFKMSARNSKEAIIIKKIIKYFKRNMSTSVGDQGLFLKAPNVFKIEYQKGRTTKHPSINLIKECALTNCSVDYTPLGSYMTYSDDEATMIAYTMTLSFQELTPVYDRDYLTGEGKDHPIGY